MTITRRDFLNANLIGAGAALCAAASPLALRHAMASGGDLLPAPDLGKDWYGYGGVGDYRLSHGNTPEVVYRAHAMRDRMIDYGNVIDNGETYDLIIVGGGMAGLGAALRFTELRRPGEKALLLDNHPVLGGESKRNEFNVDGHSLVAPQGANGFSVPLNESTFEAGDAFYYEKFGMPHQFTYPKVPDRGAGVRYGQDDYGFLYWLEDDVDVGYAYGENGAPQWAKNPWANGLKDAPLTEKLRAEFLRWRCWDKRPDAPADFRRWLDGMTYKDFVTKVMGCDPAVLSFADPVLASGAGGASDILSAYSAYSLGMPGVKTFHDEFSLGERHSFPGGNDGFARHFIKSIMPEALDGDPSFEGIINSKIRFDKLDRAGNDLRMRLGATVVRVRHEGSPDSSSAVEILYVHDRRLYKVRAKSVVMATGGWVNKHVITDLPEAHVAAYGEFVHTAFLVANVAVRHWRYIEKLGISGFRWSGDIGFACNLKRPMHVGDYRPPFHPDAPAVLSFYIPFYYPGYSALEQGMMGRTELLGTSFAEFESKFRALMTRLFSAHGFNADRDIAGIILNRWGHAYLAPQPGFYMGKDGQPSPPDVVRRRHGRIAIGHSELRGNQHWGPAAAEGARAFELLYRDVL